MTKIDTTMASKLIEQKNKISEERSNFETIWQQISEFVLPNRGDFQVERAAGARRDSRVFDTTAVQANEMLAAALHSGNMNSSSRWFMMRPSDIALADSEPAKAWLEDTMRVMYATFDDPDGNFYQQSHEMMLDLVAYGTAVMFIEENFDNGITYNTRHLSEIYIAENSRGVIDTVFRDFKFTARQAEQEWGEENLSPSLLTALKSGSGEKFEFLHSVMPRKDAERLDPSSMEGIAKNRPFVGVYICVKDKAMVDNKGYYEMPYVVIRWEKLVGESYGRSPAWNALSDIRMINVMSETIIRAAQKQVDPPLLMADDGVIMPIRTHPSGVNIGGVSSDGRPLVQPLQSGGRLEIGLEMMEQRRDAIRKAYFVDQFVQKEGTPVTATEIMQSQENSLRLTGPQNKRVQVEGLSRIISRTFAIRLRQGVFPELPEELEEANLDIDYVSPLAKNQRSAELFAMNKAIDSQSGLLQYSPEALDVFLPDDNMRLAAEISGVPTSKMRTEAQVKELRAARQKAQQEQQQAAIAMEAANSAANLKKSGVDIGV